MKLVKQPFFLIGIGSLLCAIVIAIVSTSLHPSSAVLDKFEKALNNRDGKLLAECMDPNTTENVDYSTIASQIDSVLTLLGVEKNAEFEILIGEAEVDDSDIQTIPAIIVIKVDDKVIHYSTETERIITVDGKEYLYNE